MRTVSRAILCALLAFQMGRSEPANAATSTGPFEFMKEYIRELGSLEAIRARAEKDSKTKTPDFAACIRNTESWMLELKSDINMMARTHLKRADHKDIPALIASTYRTKLEALKQLSSVCTEFYKGPKKAIAYKALAAEMPKISARAASADETILQGSILAFFTLISDKPDSHNHMSHLVITREQRDELLADLKREFPPELEPEKSNFNYQTAKIYQEKLLEYKMSDER